MAEAAGSSCQLIYRDGAAHFFDAAQDKLRYLQPPGGMQLAAAARRPVAAVAQAAETASLRGPGPHS